MVVLNPLPLEYGTTLKKITFFSTLFLSIIWKKFKVSKPFVIYTIYLVLSFSFLISYSLFKGNSLLNISFFTLPFGFVLLAPALASVANFLSIYNFLRHFIIACGFMAFFITVLYLFEPYFDIGNFLIKSNSIYAVFISPYLGVKVSYSPAIFLAPAFFISAYLYTKTKLKKFIFLLPLFLFEYTAQNH